MNDLKAIAVFCASSEGNDTKIISEAETLGKTLANENITLVYGAAKIGIMGKIAQASLDNHGKVIGVIPEFLKLKEVVHLGLTELITTDNMHERKLKMHELSDGFITLPGGFGTLEELFEIITWAQLGLHQKPIGLLNINGFYNDLISMLETMVAKGLLKMANFKLLIVEDDINRLLDKMRHYKRQPVPKWLKADRT
ncbi:TIGR00730 family Rossman fold protein [Flavobacteriaceae bacterium S0825]|uniref:LOG family protein n=1 Tax=Gaetbulibacter sp. S0825 TaxID=2720084 RepID=UPI0014314366|nr:TIGR00730 family Rossman fold protein [Gaetbulibacter sp. S0825]MCK0109170.1 TIGR00730 family Rossman fold protein [Flavobacteriaceae bacterium S0825]NIX64805.1 TIGR00730 family Rossman fold protein [Gaetbulibacter sp. S0825]